MSESLFRKEAVAQRQTQWLGTVLLAPRLSHSLFTGFAVLSTSALLGMLFWGHYTRTARISGWLVPEQGLVQVFAPQAGVVRELFVREGAEVRKGERLLVLSTELDSVALGGTQAEVTRRLTTRRQSLLETRRQLELLSTQQARSLLARIDALKSEERQISREIDVQSSRVKLARRSVSRQRSLHTNKLIADEQFEIAQQARLDQSAKLRALERSRLIARRERLTLQGELDDLPFKTQSEIANIDRTVAAVEQERAEAESRREIVVSAPEAGTVAALLVDRGGRPSTSVPLLSIVPAGSTLQAHLFSPSRAIGFLRAGQSVLLRYQPYPYQKFGHYQGVVSDLSRTAISPAELPPQLVGLTLVGVNEPVYRITVRLARQTVVAYGHEVPLSPGMQLEADVLLERRRLFEWVLDPLYTLTGNWRR